IACGAEPRQPAPVDLGDLRDAAPEPSVTVPSLDAGTLAVATPEVRFDPVLSTPENALRSLIIALSLGSRNAFSRVCTQAGLASVDEVVDPSRWKTVAEAWVRDPPRWIRRDANSSEAHVGPEV